MVPIGGSTTLIRMLAIVRIALARPYTFIVAALLIFILGTLAALRPGAVLRTSHRLDAPLQLTSAALSDRQRRTLVASGFLGQLGGRRALELLPPGKTV